MNKDNPHDSPYERARREESQRKRDRLATSTDMHDQEWFKEAVQNSIDKFNRKLEQEGG